MEQTKNKKDKNGGKNTAKILFQRTDGSLFVIPKDNASKTFWTVSFPFTEIDAIPW